MSVCLHRDRLALIINARRGDEFLVIDAYRKVVLEGIVNAITERDVIGRSPETDYLAPARDKFVIRTVDVVRVGRELMRGRQIRRGGPNCAYRFRRMQTANGVLLTAREFRQDAGIRWRPTHVKNIPLLQPFIR